MTPLAQKFARELTLPKRDRTFDDAGGVQSLFDQDMHCFEVSAIAGPVHAAMDAENLWPDIETMMPRAFLPSPVTWLEYVTPGAARVACVLLRMADAFRLILVQDRGVEPSFSLILCEFRARGPLEAGERIAIDGVSEGSLKGLLERSYQRGVGDAEKGPKLKIDPILKSITADPTGKDVDRVRGLQDVAEARLSKLRTDLGLEQAKLDMLDMLELDRGYKRFIGSCILILDLINTPGLVGLKQREPHRAFAKQLRRIGVGAYPLRSWSEVVVKTSTQIAGDGEHLSGAHFHKCLHFVRSHRRHYQSGHVALIPAHWRGDPALGIKRTRYRVETPPARPLCGSLGDEM